MRIPMLLCAAALLGACHFGGRVENFPPATSPQGVRVRLNRSLTGELLLVQDTALLVLVGAGAGGRATIAPFRRIRTADFEKLGGGYDFVGSASPDSELLARVRTVSRYPQGLTDEQLARLLASLGQKTLDVLP
jgi:hypothetical protein